MLIDIDTQGCKPIEYVLVETKPLKVQHAG